MSELVGAADVPGGPASTGAGDRIGGVRPRWITRALAALSFLLVFGQSIFHNDFPFPYHPDEPSKVAQVLDGSRNYNHPPLMLTLTRVVLWMSRTEPHPQNVARTGRFLSAFYMAGAAALLTLLAAGYGGPAGAAGAATAICTNWQVILAGHFFKEDPLFMLGLAATLLGGARAWRRRDNACFLLLGGAAGFTLSAKYLGVVAVLYALALTALAADGDRKRGGWTALGWCVSGVAVMVLAFNGEMVSFHAGEVFRGIVTGVRMAKVGNEAVGARVPHARFLGMFLLTPLPVLAGAVLFWMDLRNYPFRQHADRWFVGLSPLALLAIFSFSASTAVRYFLPVSALLGCLAGAAVPGCLRRAGRWRWPWQASAPASWPLAVCLAVLLTCNLPGLIPLWRGFAHDDRAALRAWIEHHLPAGAVIVQDRLAQLGDPDGPPDSTPSRRIESKPSVADFGSLDDLRARGVTHLVVCWYDSRRYTDPTKVPTGRAAGDYERRRRFYLDLPRRAYLLWRSELREPYPLRPGLELYAL